jgi:V8-like Glu-specific endopeptidase
LRVLSALVVVAAILLSPAARAETPAQLFADVSSGMVKIKARCPGGTQQGTGFLLGPRLVMTARHVLVDTKARRCTAEVVQEGTRKDAKVARWMGLRVTKSKSSTDVALAVLAAPLTGHNFAISRANPKRGQRVLAFGYALGEPLSRNQGHVSKLTTSQKVPVVTLTLLEAPGASGGPILDTKGEVVGLSQVAGAGLLRTVDLPRLVHRNPRELCVGVAAGQAATICGGGHRPAGLLGKDAAPPVCLGFAIAPPFQTCPKLPRSLTSAGVLAVSSDCPNGTQVGSGFLLGPRLLMTARSLLLDRKTGAACKTTVSRLLGESVAVAQSIGIQRSDGQAPADVALARLASPIEAEYLSLATTPPTVGQELHVLGWLDPQATSANTAHVTRLTTVYGMPVFEIPVASAAGSIGPGGPIVDAQHRVVGIVQGLGSADSIDSIDLQRMTNGEPGQLCLGPGDDPSATICRSRPATPGLLAAAGPPPTCGGQVATPPFSYCPFPSSPPRQVPATTDVSTPLAFTGCWATTADSFDAAQKTTTLPGSSPTLYVVYRFNFLRVGTAVSISATGPTGKRELVPAEALPITNPESTYWRDGPLNLSAAPLAPGAWTFTVTITSGPSAGASCTSTVTVTG